MAKYKNTTARLLSVRFYVEKNGQKNTQTVRFIPTKEVEVSASENKELLKNPTFEGWLEDGSIIEVVARKKGGRPSKKTAPVEDVPVVEEPAQEIPVSED